MFKIHFLRGFYVPVPVLSTEKHVENYIDPNFKQLSISERKEKTTNVYLSILLQILGKLYHIYPQILGKTQTKGLNRIGERGDLFTQQIHAEHPLCARNCRKC